MAGMIKKKTKDGHDKQQWQAWQKTNNNQQKQHTKHPTLYQQPWTNQQLQTLNPDHNHQQSTINYQRKTNQQSTNIVRKAYHLIYKMADKTMLYVRDEEG